MPTSDVVIADASPFVHLDRIGRLDLGIVPAAAPIFDALAGKGFRLGAEVRRVLLQQVGEM